MGLPAIRETHRTRTETQSRPRLRVVTAPPRTPKRNTAAHEERCRHAFRCVLIGMIAVTVFGLGRVALSAKANEASIDSSALRSNIKSEQLAADQLEVDKSALMIPSRIEAIAGTTMSMSEASDVTFITISDADEPTADESVVSGSAADTAVGDVAIGDAVDEAASETPLRALLSSVMDMAAGEAQVLLVGDIGLASSR